MWKMIDEIDLMNAIDRVIRRGTTVNKTEKSEIVEALKRVGRARTPAAISKTMIQFRCKIYDLESDKIIDATPDLFATNPIPHDIGLSEVTPTMDRIFTEWVGKEYVPLLYEIIAYCMLPDYPLHRIFCLVGSGMNGKGKYLDLIGQFIGEKNKTSTELDYLLRNRFEAAKLYKKLVCLMGETNFTELSMTSLLKRLSGGDTIGFEFKNKNPFDGYNYAKIVIATNSLPTTTDKTRGFYRRWLLIDFPNEFNEKKDILADIPHVEFENLAKKCIGILKKLLKVREFSNEGSIEDRMRRYEERSNPVSQFIKEMCKIGPNYKEPLFKFYEELKVYLTQRGHRTISKIEIGRLLRSDGFDLEKENVPTGKDEKGVTRYTKWLYIYGLEIKRKTTLQDYQEEHRPHRPNRPENPIQFLHVKQNEKRGIRGLLGPENSENPKPVGKIYHPCNYCGDEPSHSYDNKGRPICRDCFKNLSVNGIIVEEEMVED